MIHPWITIGKLSEKFSTPSPYIYLYFVSKVYFAFDFEFRYFGPIIFGRTGTEN